MRINPGLSVLYLRPLLVQVGTGARTITLELPNPGAKKFFEALREGIPDGHELNQAQSFSVDTVTAWSLISALEPVLLNHQDTVGQDPDYQLATASLHAVRAVYEDSALTGLVPATLAEFRSHRARSVVQVSGLGRIGRAVVEVLYRSGIGQQWVVDDRLVSRADLGTGYLMVDRGRLRCVATSVRLDNTKVLPVTRPASPLLDAQVSVVITQGAVPEHYISQASQSRTALLPVAVFDDETVIGPWTAPGVQVCTGCWYEHLHTSDELYSLRAEHTSSTTKGESVALAQTVAGIVGMLVLNYVDAGPLREGLDTSGAPTLPGVPAGQITTVSATDGSAHTLEVTQHARCRNHQFKVSKTA